MIDDDLPRTHFDPITLAGVLGLFFFAIIILVNMLDVRETRAESGATPTAAAFQPTFTLDPFPTSTYTHTPLPPTWTITPTYTFTPFPTATATDTPSPSPTLHPSITPTITDTPAPTATPTLMPLPTPHQVISWTLQVPILMYHYISTPPDDADIYRVDLSVEPAMFRAQMQYLVENGYSTIDLYDLSLAITNKIELPPKPVIITLDDGYVDNYWYAFPILQEFGLKATFFVITEFVDNNYASYMSWEMIEAMAAAGMRIEPHSKTHPDLSGRDRDYLIYQILGSQETIAAHIGYTPRYFAYPGGRYDELTMQILHELHFWGAVTTQGGKWHNFDSRYEWPRVRIRYTTPLAEFAGLVAAPGTVGGKPSGN
ncbi:MAG: polysaccharide deacetylase family protein [Anaerolineae bacterium]|nr:polysaccharide deacetylase family protein [Anaerolineae bacterium]